MNGVDQVPNPRRPGGQAPHQVGVEQVRVEEIDSLVLQDSGQGGQPGGVELAADAQHGHSHAGGGEPVGHRPAAQRRHVNREAAPVEAPGQLVNAPLGPRRAELGDQLADAKPAHVHNLSARPRPREHK